MWKNIIIIIIIIIIIMLEIRTFLPVYHISANIVWCIYTLPLDRQLMIFLHYMYSVSSNLTLYLKDKHLQDYHLTQCHM